MRKTQFFGLSILLILTVSFSACKKSSSDSSSSGYYVKFKLDGVQKEFKGFPNGVPVTLPSVPVIYSLSAQASLNTGVTSKNHFVVNANDIAAIGTTKTYTNVEVGGTAQTVLMYYDNEGIIYSSIMVFPESVNDAVIKFTEITSTYISGTFSGKVAPVSGGGTTTYTITEGSFKVPKL